MSLVGIINENEFYTSHYLSEIFEKDIKERIDIWSAKAQEDERHIPPYKELRSMAGDYFAMLDKLRKKHLTTPEKLELSRAFIQRLLWVLGYETQPEREELEAGFVPLLCRIDRADHSPLLWILESHCSEPCDVLKSVPIEDQFGPLEDGIEAENYDEIITSHIFSLEEPPRWVMLVSAWQIVLIDRAKWAQKRFLRFDLEEIFGRKEEATIKAVTALLHVDSLAPADGISLLDTLDENSHKHAFGVTEDLKYALREAIELLANEALRYAKEQRPELLDTPDLDTVLSRESLRYMYRLLFIFYIESRPELGYVPIRSAAYLKGYSLENLRDLELMPLVSDQDKNGYFFDDSIRLLFDMIYHGRSYTHRQNGRELFEISPLRSHLFDSDHTPLLDSVKLRNHVWQAIIRSLSLSRPGNGKKGRGRISYANLGINQLGAVYEALLSYKGFIARETLYEVKKAGTHPTPLENAYFVTESQLADYKEEERVFDSEGKLVRYPAGTFIYRLAGRDREKSASYYTPEVLTRSLVKYALKELLQDKSADEILQITVCEPAMGSAAFLNEAINQLSEAYLQRKQIETGERISHDKYILERQKVKMYLADNNVFGVDLNPTAVELAEISLWLNALFADENESFIPWFGLQLVNGNSLIGARREVYEISALKAKNKELLWYKDAPRRLSPKSLWLPKKRKTRTQAQEGGSLFDDHTKLPPESVVEEPEQKSAGRKVESEVYHFLLGDKAMADYSDKVVKTLKKEQIETIKNRQKNFIKPYSDREIEILLALSSSIDKLWQEHTRHQHEMRKKTTDPLKVWGQPGSERKLTDLKFKDTVLQKERNSLSVKSSSPYRRLKMVMDYWCALWFWPIDEADKLPTRAQFFEDISRLVDKRGDILMDLDKDLFSETMDEEEIRLQLDELGFIDVDELIAKNERLQVVQRVAKAQKFLHWELEFADIFAKRGGFDLILGNPPWLKVEWNEGGIMGEANPLFEIRKFSASRLNELRSETFKKYPKLFSDYIAEYESAEATQNFLNAATNYPLLKGVQTNLYKCFLPTAWRVGNKKAVTGLLHPEGVYDDPKGGGLRREIYKRLKYHFQFQNGKNLFPIAHRAKFSTNIFFNANKEVNFTTIANLFLPQTIDASFEHSGEGAVGGIKNDENRWNIEGHKHRIVPITKEELKFLQDSMTKRVHIGSKRACPPSMPSSC
ncbi:type II restriction enzyme, methylase subunits [Hydrogenimonas sp.]|nr:type II restriction enzyme, methylase subunits [Hydrogenimonas sp.]